MMHDLLSKTLSQINNAEKAGKKEIIVAPISKQIKAVFKILKTEGYIKDFEIVIEASGGQARIKLSNTINKIGVIKPRFPSKLADSEKFEKRYLPAKDFGRLIISTSQGIMTHIEAQKKKIGGILLAYVY